MELLPFINPFTWGIVWWIVALVETIMVTIICYKPIRDKLENTIETNIPISILAGGLSVVSAILVAYVLINAIGLFNY